MRSLSNSLRAAQRGSQAHSQTPYVRLVFSPPDNFLTNNPARIYTTRQAPNRILSVQHIQGRYGVSLPVTETPNVAAIVILSNHDGSLSASTWEGWLLRPYFGLVVGNTPEYQEAESLLVSRAIFHGSEGTSTLELHLISAWGRLTQTWVNRTTSSGPVKWLRGHPSFRRTIGQIVHELCGGGTPEIVRIQDTGVEYVDILKTYAPFDNGDPSIVNWDGSSLYIVDTRQKFNTVNVGIRGGDATAITSVFPTAVLTVTGDLSSRGVVTIRLADSVPLQQAIVLSHNGTSLEIEYITTSRDLGLYFTSNSQLEYEPTYVSRGQANLLEVLREVLSRTTYRPILRETGITLVDIGSEADSVEGDTSRQYLTDHQIFSHEPSRKLLVPNEIVVSSIAQGVEPTLQKPYWEGKAPSPTAPSTHPAIISQQSQGKITRYEVESSISSDAEAQIFAESYIDALAFDTATARFSANMDVGLEVYDNVLVGHDEANDNLDAGDPWTGLTSLGYVSDIMRIWTPGFYRISVTLGDIQTVYVPLTQSRQNYLTQQGLLTKEGQDGVLFETSEIPQAVGPDDTFWGRTQSLSINALIPTGPFPISGAVASPWSGIFSDAVNIGTIDITLNPGTPQEEVVPTTAWQLTTANDAQGGVYPIIYINPNASDGLVIDSGGQPSTVRPANFMTDLGSSAAYWDTFYINRIAAVGFNPQMIGFTSIFMQSTVTEVSAPGQIALVGSDVHVYSGGNVVDLSNLGSGTTPGMITLVGTHGILVSGYTIILDSDDMPPLYPAAAINGLGLATNPWNDLYVGHVRLTPDQPVSIIDGDVWQNSNGDILARTGGETKNLSDIGAGIVLTGSHGILVAGYSIILDSDDMPPLYPANAINGLGTSAAPWDNLYVDHVYLTPSEPSSSINGTIWLDTNNDIQVRTGGDTKSLSDIGAGITLTGGNGILVSGHTIILDADDMPPLQPASSINDLGISSNPWDRLYVDHIFLHLGESASVINGALWQDSAGDIMAQTGGTTKNLSDIGSGGIDSITLTGSNGILVSGYNIILDNDDMPPLYPASSINGLGTSSNPWDNLFVDHIYLHAGESASSTNGAIWQDSSGDIQARSGGITRNLSDIGSGGSITLTGSNGILVSGYNIILDNDDMPALQPASSINGLGISSNPWDSLYVDHIYLHTGESASSVNGALWQNSDGDILARSGGVTKNLSDIGDGGTATDITLTGGNGILISGYTIILDNDDMPPLYPANSINGLGLTTNPWDSLHVDHIYLHQGESAVTTNGAIWQDSSGDIQARTGGVTKNLSDIGSGGGTTFTAGEGILISGSVISLDADNIPTIKPEAGFSDLGSSGQDWDTLYVDHIRFNSGEPTITINGFMWLDSSGNIRAYSGGVNRNLSAIGVDTDITLTAGPGILVSGYIITLDSDDMPPLQPADSINGLGITTNPWDSLYVDHIYLHANENTIATNGVIWQDNSGDIRAYSGGESRNLSDIGSGGSITLTAGPGILVAGNIITLDSDDMPTLQPASSINDLGISTNPWDALYVDHIYLHTGEGASTTNGALWQDVNGDIQARTGGVTRNLSDIGLTTSITLTGSNGILVSGYNIILDNDDMPPLYPASSINGLGISSNPWDSLYVDHIYLHANEAASATSGAIWQDSSGNIMARSGGVNRNLSDIGSGVSSITLTGGAGISVSGYTISIDSNNLPTLLPASSGNDLGSPSFYWDKLYVDHIHLNPGQLSVVADGSLWQDSGGNIIARTGGALKSLSNIGTGTSTVTLIGGSGILVSGSTISLDGTDMPTLTPSSLGNDLGTAAIPWDRLYVDHIFLNAGENAFTANGIMWQDSNGDIRANSGGISRNLSDIGSGSSTITLTGGNGISVSGYAISLDGTDMPTLTPTSLANDLGTNALPWDRLYVDHIFLTAGESPFTANGILWQDSSGNILARSGGSEVSLSDIGSGGGTSGISTLVEGVGISITGSGASRTITLDFNNLPGLNSGSSVNDLGTFVNPWDALYVDHIYLHIGESSTTTSGTIWQNVDGDILARSGGVTRNLSDIGSGGGTGITTLSAGNGISVIGSGSSRTISVGGANLPTLLPIDGNRNLGSSSTGGAWDRLYVDYLYLHTGGGPITINGVMWQESGTIYARSGGVTRNLSNIGSGGTSITLFGGTGIQVAGYAISLDFDDMPSLLPANPSHILGAPDTPWDGLHVDHIFLHANENSSTTNGVLWQDGSGNIMARTGGITRSLSDIGSGTGGSVTLLNGAGINIVGTSSPFTISIDSFTLPTLIPGATSNDLGSDARPWDRLYVDHLYLNSGEGDTTASGAIWQNSSGDIIARSGGDYRNLSDIGSGGTFDGNNMPTLRPASTGNDLGVSGDAWDSLYIDHLYLSLGEGAISTNGVMWQDSSGNIQARSGGITRNLSDIGSGGGNGSVTGGTGITVSGSTVSIDGTDMPTLLPGASSFDLGSNDQPWDRLYVDHIYMHVAAGSPGVAVDGTMWQDGSGHIWARSGGLNRRLSDIGSFLAPSNILLGAHPITVSTNTPVGTGRTVGIDRTDMPSLWQLHVDHGGDGLATLGVGTSPWYRLWVTKIFLSPNGLEESFDGTMWQDFNDNIRVRSGGVVRNLSNVVTPLDTNNLPSLLPIGTINTLGSSNDRWDRLYVDHVILHPDEYDISANGAMWQGSNGDVYVYTGGTKKNLSDIGSGGGTTTFDGDNMPTLRPSSSVNDLGISSDPWDSLYVDHIYLTANEAGLTTNGTIWQSSNGDIFARSGSVTRNLSDIGSGGTTGTTYSGGVGIIVSGSVISLDNLGLPTLIPSAAANVLGASFDPWDSLYVDHVRLTSGEVSSTTNGVMWQASDGHIYARTGGVTKDLSDIGTGGGTTTFDGDNMPTLRPASSVNDLGISSDPWDSLYVDHIYLSANEGSTSTNGVLWQGSGGDIYARTGGVTKNLSDIGSGGGGTGITTLTGGQGITVSGSGSSRTVAIDAVDIPSLEPAFSTAVLGAFSFPWSRLYIDYILFTSSQNAFSNNGNMWQDGSGNIMAYSGGSARNLSDIGGGGGGTTYIGGAGILVSGNTISIDSLNMPTLRPVSSGLLLGSLFDTWGIILGERIAALNFQLQGNQADETGDGNIWKGAGGHVFVRTGGVTKDLNNIPD